MSMLHHRSSPTHDVEKGHTTHHAAVNGNGNGSIADTQVDTGAPVQHGGYKGSGGYVNRAVTPGGHPLDTSQPAFPVYHRK
jgi:hypothetical protein